MNRINVLLFATLKQRAGIKQVLLDLPEGANVRDLKSRLSKAYPGLEGIIDIALVSVNREFADNEDLIPHGAEVALFPPVSGGTDGTFPTLIAITEDELDMNKLLTLVTLSTTGAACVFVGTVRGFTNPQNSLHQEDEFETLSLEYEAYTPMAEAKMRQVAEEIRFRWPQVQGVAIVQRVGRLSPGTPTVLIACTAAHRDTGVFDAARYGIDRLKEIVPIWKKEIGKEGEHWVEGSYVPNHDHD